MATWKRDIASGLIVLLPLIVTAYVIAYIFGILANSALIPGIDPQALQSAGIPIVYLGVIRVATTLVVFFLLVLSIGYMSRTAFGDIFEGVIDDLMNRLPGLRVVYNASKMAVETAVSGADDLQKPVKLETWNGLRMTAFKTGKVTDDGRHVLFLPTAPNITTGFVIEVEPDEYTETDERVEDALTRILSAGFGESRDKGVPIDVTDELLGDGETENGDGEVTSEEAAEPAEAAGDDSGGSAGAERAEDD
jgi:uncharacterized membrane protein